MRKRNMIAIGIFLTFYVVFGIILTVRQERMVYQPWSQDFASCSGFADAEKVVYEGTRMYVERGERGVVVFYHGNAGSACDRSSVAAMVKGAGWGYIVPEYAGYSNDTRTPTHELVKQDVRNVTTYLVRMGTTTVRVMGESVGTGPTSYHTSIAPPEAILLLAPFASLADVAARKFWYYPTRYLVDNAFDNIALLSTYEGSVTIIHGMDDRIVPYTSGELLLNALVTEQKELVSVVNTGHNNLMQSAGATQAIRVFLKS